MQMDFPVHGLQIQDLSERNPYHRRSLADTFFRCHRSYIVNFDHVQHYKKEEIWLDNEVVLPLSRRRYQAFGLAFMYYLKNRGDVF